jgi:hypothetical protein
MISKKINAKFIILVISLLSAVYSSNGQVLNKQAMLDKFSFWHNKDWEWYKVNIPFFESPDADIDLTYYYRWELMTAHMVYGSPETGYTSTEFIDRPGWSGKYGAISCPAGHQLYEYRWIRDNRYAQDFARYWFRTPGAQPRTYSNWVGDAIWQTYKVSKDKAFVTDLKSDLVKNYAAWESEHWIEGEGMFSWDGMHDGMETNINSRQTKNWFSGAPGYRPTLNSYMWADAIAIKNISSLSGDERSAALFNRKAETIKKNFQQKCWDPKRNFFFQRYQKDEDNGIKANTLTHQTGKFAGSPYGREEIGFVPWYFNMPDQGYEAAWQFLMDTSYFFAPFGPTTVEKNDPLFNIAKNCCAWSGNAWPYATSQTLKAMANVIRNYKQNFVNKKDYFTQLKIFTLTHRKNGQPYIAEANHPETGSWSGHDNIGHSEHYFHSAYIDEIITGLVGLEPKETDSISVNPLIPDQWEYFALDDINYHGHDVSIIWDKLGIKYNRGKGLSIISDGKVIANSPVVKKLSAFIEYKQPPEANLLLNYAVNNESNKYYPRAISSFPGIGNNMYGKVNDGQYWYYSSTTNRWSNLYSPGKKEWIGIDFGGERPINTVKVYFLEDSAIRAPNSYQLEFWNGKSWINIPAQKRTFDKPAVNKANTISFDELNISKLRVVVIPQNGLSIGVSELEAWGPKKADLKMAVEEQTPSVESVGYKTEATVTTSYTSRFDQLQFINDGLANPTYRWTAFESPNPKDWVQFDFRRKTKVSNAYLFFYSDKRGVQPPKDYTIQYWNGNDWKDVQKLIKKPEDAVAGLNISAFKEVNTQKLRLVFAHKNEKAFTGLYEIELFGKK